MKLRFEKVSGSLAIGDTKFLDNSGYSFLAFKVSVCQEILRRYPVQENVVHVLAVNDEYEF